MDSSKELFRRNTLREKMISAVDFKNYTAKNTIAASYVGIFVFIIGVVAVGYQPTASDGSVASAATTTSAEPALNRPSVDKLVATQVAAGIAEQANLPIASNVANLSVSLSAESALAQTNSDIIAKPQIVQPSADSRELKSYTTAAGDTADSVAAKFGVSAVTVKWANDLESDAMEPGKTLTILPIDGVLYNVKDGDTVQSIAEKYKSSAEQITAYNDLEIDGVKSGVKIVLPGGRLPEKEQPGYTAPIISSSQSTYGTSYGSYGTSSTGISFSTAAASAGNRYAFGNCTSYAYERRAQLGRPIGSFWGNASTWAAYARAAGYTVNGSPAAGAIMQNSGGYAGYGHVAVVEEVVAGQYVRISEMNSYRNGGGFNIISGANIPWGEALSGMYQYIH